MIHHLEDNGTMAVVLPHGVLFRGAAEGVIRKHLIEQRNVLDAVIDFRQTYSLEHQFQQ
ncbi:type I restriction-modification system, M subunit [Clostridium perfringens]|nr:type I restriction-modification system, M subunit [Clostridium perfringens]